MFKALILTAIACLLNIGAPIVNSSVVLNVYEKQSEYIEIEKPKEKLVTYDDVGYGITLSADEVNNYTFTNLHTYLTNLSTEEINDLFQNCLYNSLSFDLVDSDDEAGYLRFNRTSAYVIEFNTETPNKFIYSADSGDNFISFEYSIQFDIIDTYYDTFKQAIEADILANTQSENMPSITDIFNEIASAVTNFITTLVSAFNGVTTLFWDAAANSGAGGFTFLGVLVLIGCGVGLVYLAYRVIKGLMHRV